MKIAIVNTYFAPEVNGLTKYIEGLYGALLDAHPEIEVDVITFDTLKTGIFEEQIGKFHVYRVPCYTFMGRTYAVPTFSGYRKFMQIFAQKKYDAINTHTRFFFTSFLGLLAAKKHHNCLVHTEHGSGFVEHGNMLVEIIAKVYDFTLGKIVLKNADKVCGVSQAVCLFAEKMGAKQAKVVYNGIDTGFWQKPNDGAQTKRELRINEDKIVFTFVGRLVPSKGVQDVIDVLSQIETFSWKFLIVGDGIYRKNLENLVAQKKLEERIKFLGLKSREDVRDILKISDLFINPSFAAEGMPTTILEAAAAGTKCLSSDMGGSVEILKEENLYTAGNKDVLREKIANYQKLSFTDVEKFDWKNIQEEFFKVLESVR